MTAATSTTITARRGRPKLFTEAQLLTHLSSALSANGGNVTIAKLDAMDSPIRHYHYIARFGSWKMAKAKAQSFVIVAPAAPSTNDAPKRGRGRPKLFTDAQLLTHLASAFSANDDKLTIAKLDAMESPIRHYHYIARFGSWKMAKARVSSTSMPAPKASKVKAAPKTVKAKVVKNTTRSAAPKPAPMAKPTLAAAPAKASKTTKQGAYARANDRVARIVAQKGARQGFTECLYSDKKMSYSEAMAWSRELLRAS